MSSKTLLFVALLCALVLVSSTWAAKTTPQEQTKGNDVKEPDWAGGRCRYGCCGVGLHGRCGRCCKTEAEAEAADQLSVDINGHGGGGWGGGGGGQGGGGGGWGGGGGGGGGHCRYGCCGGYGRYCRCCYNPEEAQAVQFGD